MEAAFNGASWSRSRQAEGGQRIDRGTDLLGRVEDGEQRGVRGGRRAGCMATQAALLYQEAPVGALLPNAAKAMPNRTSANRAAITVLINASFFSFSILSLSASQSPC